MSDAWTNIYYKDSAPALKEERATVLEDWLSMETNFGDVSVVQPKFPKKLKNRKPITREDVSIGYVLQLHISFLSFDIFRF